MPRTEWAALTAVVFVLGFANQIVANPADASLVRQQLDEALLEDVEVIAEIDATVR